MQLECKPPPNLIADRAANVILHYDIVASRNIFLVQCDHSCFFLPFFVSSPDHLFVEKVIHKKYHLLLWCVGQTISSPPFLKSELNMKKRPSFKADQNRRVCRNWQPVCQMRTPQGTLTHHCCHPQKKKKSALRDERKTFLSRYTYI